MHHFMCLGSSIATQITQIVYAAWETGRYAVVCGVLYDRKMPVKLMGKVYKAVVRPQIRCMVQKHGQQREDKKHD